MFGTHDLPLFILSGLLLNMTPGQDTFYILGRTLSQGRAAGLYSALGISAGCLVHTVLAAVGISAILAASPVAFATMKYAGAGYLVWLGLRLLLTNRVAADLAAFERGSGWAVFRAGLLTNVLNPKVAIFFMAFLPQFVSPAAESRALAMLFLGSVFVAGGMVWCLCLVLAAARVSTRLRRQPSASLWLNRLAGAVFVGLGVRLAVAR